MKNLLKATSFIILISVYSIIAEGCLCPPEDRRITGLMEMNIINSAYAISCDPDSYLNTLNQSTFKLTCDKDFTYDNQIIPANMDYARIEELQIQIDIPDEYLGSIGVKFTEEFISKAQFQNTDYTFKFEIETEDGVQLSAEKTLVMNL